MIAAETKVPVLEFDNVTIESPPPRCAAARNVRLQVGEGELVILRTQRTWPYSALVPAAEGLWELDGGEVRFDGEGWSDAAALRDGSRRGQIGRVFSGCGWVSNLNVVENITLPQRHHTSRPTREIEEEAEALGQRFGLTGIPSGRPSFVPESLLRRAEWVRALLGEPRLLLLEEPMRGVESALLPKLVDAVDEARHRNAAVLWVTDDASVANHAFAEPVRRYAMHHDALRSAEETS